MDLRLEEVYQQYSQIPELEHLRKTAKQLVKGHGNSNADIVFCGEAPGANEDEQGIPFVGRSGQWLNEMLDSVGLSRPDCFITNIVKYRPPNNRTPTEEESLASLPFLVQELKIIKPKVFVPLGIPATRTFVKFGRMSEVNGQLIKTPGGNKIFPLYHPSYCLRNGGMKEDMLIHFQELARII